MPKAKHTSKSIYKLYLKLQRSKKKKEVVSISDLKDNGLTVGQMRTHYKNLTVIETKAFKEFPNIFPPNHEVGKKHLSREEIYQRYIKYRSELGAMPRPTDVEHNVARKSSWYRFFKNIKAMEAEARERNPEMFRDVPLTHVKNDRKVRRTNKEISNTQRFFVTTAVTGCYVNPEFYKSIKNYCKRMDAKLLVLVAEDPAKQKTHKGDHTIDMKLINDEDHIIVQDTALNSNIHLSTIKLSAKQIDATTGLDRLTQAGTFLYASPKQRLKPVPVGNTKLVHLLATTGAITEPDYNTDMYMSLRTAYIADFDHVMGGVIVELDKNDMYHFRHVQMDEDGSFIDIGTKYSANGKISKESPIALHAGDWHTGHTCPMVKACVKDMCEELSPTHFLLHDFFDGVSVNPHIDKDRVELAIMAEKGQTSLETELRNLKEELDEIVTWNIKFIDIVYSNHDDFLNRFLRAAKYADTSHSVNHRISLKLALSVLDGKNPVEYGVNELMKFKHKQKVRWLKLDQDFILAGIQMGAHGHLGANGSRAPSIAGLERVYKLSNTGHTHGSEILRGAWRAGTSTYLKVGYNKGPSSWSNSHIITYRNGARQIIYTINGKWHLDSKPLKY